MNILNKVTLKTLYKNRTRTIVSIIGIILSASMFTAITTLVSSLQQYMISISIYDKGDYYGSFHDITNKDIAEYKSNAEISQISIAQNIGYAKIKEPLNKNKPFIFVYGVDQKFIDTMPIRIVSGRMPSNPNELLLPIHLTNNSKEKYDLNETLNLDIGLRFINKSHAWQFTSYRNFENEDADATKDEEFQHQYNKKYKIVGLYERPSFEKYNAPGYTAITISNGKPMAGKSYDAYIKTNDAKNFYPFAEAEVSQKNIFLTDNKDYLMYMGASKYGSFYSMLYGLAAILIALIVLGSVSLIYNAFSISVSERTRDFGLLSSIGATRRQITKSVLTEAVYVSLIGIPIGVLCGIAGIGITLKLLEAPILSMYSIEMPISLSLHVNTPSILIAAIIALITVLISAWIPSRKARKITAIEAIRQSKDILIKAKKIRVSKLTYKLFGLEGLIAKKHFKRNRKKYRATIISLFMSIVIFIAAASYCQQLEYSITGVFEPKDYDILYDANKHQNDYQQVYSALSNTEGVENSSIIKSISIFTKLDDSILTDDYKAVFPDKKQLITIIKIDDSTYKKYLSMNNLSPETYMNPQNPIGISINQYSGFDSTQQKQLDFKIFKTDSFSANALLPDSKAYQALNKQAREKQAKLPESKRSYMKKMKLNVHVSTSDLPFGLSSFSKGNICVFYPECTIESINCTSIMFYFKATDHTTVYEKMVKTLRANGVHDISNLYDDARTSDITRNLILIMNVFSYGFIVLIALISVANVFNTISTNISLRRREFAMLKSVGMTKRGFNKMMNFECLLYGLKALLWGLPVAIAISYLIYKAINIGYTLPYSPPWIPITISILSVFAIVFATMMYSMSKIKKDNPIDALKNDNL